MGRLFSIFQSFNFILYENAHSVSRFLELMVLLEEKRFKKTWKVWLPRFSYKNHIPNWLLSFLLIFKKSNKQTQQEQNNNEQNIIQNCIQTNPNKIKKINK